MLHHHRVSRSSSIRLKRDVVGEGALSALVATPHTSVSAPPALTKCVLSTRRRYAASCLGSDPGDEVAAP